MITQHQLTIATQGRGLINVTKEIKNLIEQTNVTTGLCHIFLHHTSASLIICENADPLVQADLEAFMYRLIPDGDPLFQHTDEGADDMPAHIRTVLTQIFLMLPISNNRLTLGTWQGLYLWEHRLQGYQRRMTVTIYGE